LIRLGFTGTVTFIVVAKIEKQDLFESL